MSKKTKMKEAFLKAVKEENREVIIPKNDSDSAIIFLSANNVENFNLLLNFNFMEKSVGVAGIFTKTIPAEQVVPATIAVNEVSLFLGVRKGVIGIDKTPSSGLLVCSREVKYGNNADLFVKRLSYNVSDIFQDIAFTVSVFGAAVKRMEKAFFKNDRPKMLSGRELIDFDNAVRTVINGVMEEAIAVGLDGPVPEGLLPKYLPEAVRLFNDSENIEFLKKVLSTEGSKDDIEAAMIDELKRAFNFTNETGLTISDKDGDYVVNVNNGKINVMFADGEKISESTDDFLKRIRKNLGLPNGESGLEDDDNLDDFPDAVDECPEDFNFDDFFDSDESDFSFEDADFDEDEEWKKVLELSDEGYLLTLKVKKDFPTEKREKLCDYICDVMEDYDEE